jgi:hypothetical protein
MCSLNDKCVLLLIDYVLFMIICALLWGQVPTDIEHTELNVLDATN